MMRATTHERCIAEFSREYTIVNFDANGNKHRACEFEMLLENVFLHRGRCLARFASLNAAIRTLLLKEDIEPNVKPIFAKKRDTIGNGSMRTSQRIQRIRSGEKYTSRFFPFSRNISAPIEYYDYLKGCGTVS
jgi:hypothetical protein